ncbi:hypothetical protein Dsin_023330 [Dipteronia sinensis]|uniref:Uncharacterized protein n=1 Tax=Dipteronia sinensis TaxID=43782 RepID=A0AAE0E0K4_9ROSI|nr:hypothetical protein Dsin_023330 [Dipteronia sinensis]
MCVHSQNALFLLHLQLLPLLLQKIVITLKLKCDKCRSKAMKIAAVADGVISVAWEGDEKNKVVMTGDGTDAAIVTWNLHVY